MLQSEISKWQKIKSLLSIIDIARMKKKSDVSDFIFWNDQYCIILDRITYIATESGRDILANFVKIYRFEFQVETWRSLDENARDITQGRSASAEDRSTSVHVSSSIWRHLPVNLYELFASHLSLIINPMIERNARLVRVGTRGRWLTSFANSSAFKSYEMLSKQCTPLWKSSSMMFTARNRSVQKGKKVNKCIECIMVSRLSFLDPLFLSSSLF